MISLESNRLRDLLAARRALTRAALALGCAPVVMTMIAGATADALLVLALPLLPLVFLLLIVAGVIDAEIRDSGREHKPRAGFPRPLLCRG